MGYVCICWDLGAVVNIGAVGGISISGLHVKAEMGGYECGVEYRGCGFKWEYRIPVLTLSIGFLIK